jgi:hypothetical protein
MRARIWRSQDRVKQVRKQFMEGRLFMTSEIIQRTLAALRFSHHWYVPALSSLFSLLTLDAATSRADTWEPAPPMPTARAGLAAATSSDGNQIYEVAAPRKA